jgi:hypothetical protein
MKTLAAQYRSFLTIDFYTQSILLALIIVSAVLDDYYVLDLIVGFGAMQAFSMLYVFILVPKAITKERKFHMRITLSILVAFGIVYLNSKFQFLEFMGNGLFIAFLIVVLLSIIASLYYYVITLNTLRKPERGINRAKA